MADSPAPGATTNRRRGARRRGSLRRQPAPAIGWLSFAILAATLLPLAVAARIGWQAAGGATLLDDTRFNIVRWELMALPNRWLYQLGVPLRDDPSPDDALTQYFAVNAEIARLERESGDAPAPAQAAQLTSARERRRRLENHVEAIIEWRLTAVLKEQRLTTAAPGLSRRIVWPPVDFELAAAPRVLAESPRSRIALLSSDLLSNSLSREEAYAIEAAATDSRRVAIVLPTSGVAAYPSIVDETDGYRDMVETAAHEWLHQYLAFHTLGWRYFRSGLRDVNETVASIGGDGLAALVLARYPSPPALRPEGEGPRADDVRVTLTALRREVDALLAAGQVERAEARMEEVRLDLARRGTAIRKLNQAYFAFRGLYATSGAAAGDLGPRLQDLYRRSGSVGAFIHAVEGVGSRRELDKLLAR